jgi:hypothetical protein
VISIDAANNAAATGLENSPLPIISFPQAAIINIIGASAFDHHVGDRVTTICRSLAACIESSACTRG